MSTYTRFWFRGQCLRSVCHAEISQNQFNFDRKNIGTWRSKHPYPVSLSPFNSRPTNPRSPQQPPAPGCGFRRAPSLTSAPLPCPHGEGRSPYPRPGRLSCPRSHLGAACRGPDPRPDPPVPRAVAPLAALPRLPRPVPAAGSGLHHIVPAIPLPRRLAPPLGSRFRLPPARGALLPPALVLAVPVPLPAPAAARALRGHRAGARAVGGLRAQGLRAPAAGAEGAADGAAAGVRSGRGAHHRAQRRDHRGLREGVLLDRQAQPHLRCG